MNTLFKTPLSEASPAFLQSNNEAYEWLVGKISTMKRTKGEEALLNFVQKTAQFAVEYHTSRFADGAIENVAFEIGAKLDTDTVKKEEFSFPAAHNQDSRRRVLHVVTGVLNIGGLTRMLCHWAGNDLSSCHSVVLTNQKDVPIPPWLSEAVRASGGKLVVLPARSHLCRKARRLREMARDGADLVILHHFGSDVLPTVAFAVPECPPVAVLNHADHLFWLGSSVADMVINLRTPAAQHTAERRFVSCNYVIPVPLSYPEEKMSRPEARTALGIEKDIVMLLSIGRSEKYQSCGSYDFVATANKILERHPNAHLFVIGETAEGIAPYLRCAIHERLHFVGSMEDPSLYRVAADVYMESFPFGSQTALLEAALSGLPVVPAYAPLFPLLVANDDTVTDILPSPHDENAYIECVDLLIRQPDQRAALGSMLRERLLIDHVGEGWLKLLTTLYHQTDRLTHNPHPIDKSPFHATEADISLSLWHVMAGRTLAPRKPDDIEGATLCHTAFVAKVSGNYAMARRYAWRAVRHDPFQLTLWRLLTITLIGRTGKYIRQCLAQIKDSLDDFSYKKSEKHDHVS